MDWVQQQCDLNPLYIVLYSSYSFVGNQHFYQSPHLAVEVLVALVGGPGGELDLALLAVQLTKRRPLLGAARPLVVRAHVPRQARLLVGGVRAQGAGEQAARQLGQLGWRGAQAHSCAHWGWKGGFWRHTARDKECTDCKQHL